MSSLVYSFGDVCHIVTQKPNYIMDTIMHVMVVANGDLSSCSSTVMNKIQLVMTAVHFMFGKSWIQILAQRPAALCKVSKFPSGKCWNSTSN